MKLALTITLALFATACAEERRGDAAAGARIYAAACADCHAADGAGVGGDPSTSGIDLRERIYELSDSQIARTILEGTGEMAPLALTDDEVYDVIAFVRNGWRTGDD